MEKVKFKKASDNIFRDFGFPDADAHLHKSNIVTRIDVTLRRHKWTQKRAAKVLGLSKTKLSRILQGDFQDFSVEKLESLLEILRRDVEPSKDTRPVARAPKLQRPIKSWKINEEKKKSKDSIKKVTRSVETDTRRRSAGI